MAILGLARLGLVTYATGWAMFARDCDQRRSQSSFPRENNTRGGQPPKPCNKLEGRFYQVYCMSNSLVFDGVVNGVECQCLINTRASFLLVPLSIVRDRLIRPVLRMFNCVQ